MEITVEFFDKTDGQRWNESHVHNYYVTNAINMLPRW